MDFNVLYGRQVVRFALIAAVASSTFGCNIPGLRCAKPGPAMPAAFHLNNGLAFWQVRPEVMPAAPKADKAADGSDGKESDTEVNPPDADDEDSESVKKPSARRGLFGLIKHVSFLQDTDEQDSEKLRQLDEKIRLIEEDLNEDTDQPDANAAPRPQFEPTQAANDAPEIQEYSSDAGEIISTVDGTSSATLPVNAFYDDPFLLDLINQALVGNQELKILAEEIRIACNETYARSGEYRPFVSLGAGAGFDKVGRHTREGAVEEQLEVAPGTEFPEPLGDFLVAANVSWELDIWNRLRNGQRAAAMRYFATQEGRNYVVTRLVAEVAENYYELLSLDAQLQILETTIAIQQDSLQVAVAKKTAGRDTELAVQRFRGEVQKNESRRGIIRQQIVEAENRINFLVGRNPQPVDRITTEFADLNLSTLGTGVPSELLLNRADIREAERRVAAAGLDVKVARARFYPNLSLTAGLGWNAFSSGYLFRTPESLMYGLAGELVGPLINMRAIKADYCSANAAQLQAIYEYQQTVLEAHIEVVNQLTKVENYRRSIEVKRRQLDALNASVETANKLFQNARAEYVEVLLAQRELQEAREELVEIKQEQLAAIVNVYQALGGGL